MKRKPERQRLLELAGLDAKRILSEAKIIRLQIQVDDDEEDIPDFINQAKRYGLKAKYEGPVRTKADEHFIQVEIPRDQRKLMNFLVQEMGWDKEDIEDMYPELDTSSLR
jgi:hypothetical protein